uniref:Uncharacterized protein n=1 Tax=Lactuca sativa TaxID=4236 RepID=A0A9R1XJ26_LACSA|nr:hypothetical protein LSAT_V11C300142730 [Lactuca sativa]
MTSNNAESVNALFIDSRKMHIIPLLEFFHCLSQEWCNKCCIDGVLTEWGEKVVRKNEERTTRLFVLWSCHNGLKALEKTDFGHLAIDAYQMETLPLPESCDWELLDEMMVVKPPIMDTRQAGRPKNKNRIPSQGEEPIVRRCSRCDSTTHNAGTCPALVPVKKKNPKK